MEEESREDPAIQGFGPAVQGLVAGSLPAACVSGRSESTHRKPPASCPSFMQSAGSSSRQAARAICQVRGPIYGREVGKGLVWARTAQQGWSKEAVAKAEGRIVDGLELRPALH